MAARRTKVIYTAKKLLPFRSPTWKFFGKILASLGRPFFWSLLLGGYFILKILSSGLNVIFSLFRFLIALPNKISPPKISFSKIRLPRITKRFIVFILLMIIFSLSVVTLFYSQILKDLPGPDRLITRNQILSTKIYDRHGRLLYKIYRSENRTLVELKDLPASLLQATLAVEDAEFYHHRGLSLRGILRAMIANLKGEKFEGGSTITQQLVKNALLTPERTVKRKIKEIVLALAVERKFTKDQILGMYFNQVGYGGAAYGAEEASQLYFGKSVSQVSLAQAALLAGLPASPTSYSPFGAHPEKAIERQKLVLYRMLQENFINENQYQQAVSEKLIFSPQRQDIQAPHFVMYVKEILAKQFGERTVEEGGLEVNTSLDLDIQNFVQETVRQEVEKLWNLKVTNGAAIVTKPQTGEILAMVGSQDYFDLERDGNYNVTTSLRQPGSSIKPINYAVALQMGFTPATIIPDTPITYHIPGQPPYSPKNYDNRFHGNVSLRTALGSSYNVPAVKVLSALGVSRMIEQGEKMGITSWNDQSRYGLSLTLGGGEVKMTEMAVAYGTLANMGTKINLKTILGVKNTKGKVLVKDGCNESAISSCRAEDALPRSVAYLLSDILSDNNARTPAFGPRSLLNIPGRPHVAVKTGTTQNLRDNWTIGYTSDFVVATWVGNNDNSPMSWVASGVTGASPIWNKIITYLLKDIPDKEFPKPEDVKRVEICPLTNTLPCEGCGGRWEYFLPGTEPRIRCDPEKIKEMQTKKEEIKPTPQIDQRVYPSPIPKKNDKDKKYFQLLRHKIKIP